MNKNPTTVKELIEILEAFPANLPVLVSGYESGYDCFCHPEVRDLVRKSENMYRDVEYQTPVKGEAPEFSALILERVNRDD